MWLMNAMHVLVLGARGGGGGGIERNKGCFHLYATDISVVNLFTVGCCRWTGAKLFLVA